MDIFKKIGEGIYNFLKWIVDTILTNRFVQICIVVILLNIFPGNLFKHTKFGIFINGTDNTYHNNYDKKSIRDN